MSEEMLLKQQQMQEMQQHLSQIQQRMQVLNQQMQELEGVKEAIIAIQSSETGDEILVPLGAGVFRKASLLEDTSLIMNVGSNVAVKKSAQDAQTLVEKQIAALQDIEKTMQKDMAQMSQQMQMSQMR